MSHGLITKLRTARKPHRCVLCRGAIAVGEQHYEYTEFPNSDIGYASFAGHPVRFRECAACISKRSSSPVSVGTK